MRLLGLALLATALACSLLTATAGEADPAGRVLDVAGLTHGVACLPRCGTGELALDLTRRSRFLVLAMDNDPANVRAARVKAAAAGLLGRRLYVKQGVPRPGSTMSCCPSM